MIGSGGNSRAGPGSQDGAEERPDSGPFVFVSRLWKSPSIRATAAFGSAGIGFAAGNILLARALPAQDYGRFALAVALVQISSQTGPAGIDGVINRRLLHAGRIVFSRSIATSALTAVAIAIIGSAVYGLAAPLLVSVLVGGAAASMGSLAGAHYQSKQRFGLSLGLSQSPNFGLLIAGMTAVFVGSGKSGTPMMVYTIACVVPAGYGWARILRERGDCPPGGDTFRWSEALSFLGVKLAGTLLLQMDRLVIPRAISYGALARFGVFASVAGAPFRMLQSGVGFTMLPQLSASQSPQSRRRILWKEMGLILGISLVAGVVLFFATPWAVDVLLSGKYGVETSLVLALIVAGMVKVISSFFVTAAAALSSTRDLALLNGLGWVAVAVSAIAGLVGTRWGLTGLVYGVGSGWLLRACLGLAITLPYLAKTENRVRV